MSPLGELMFTFTYNSYWLYAYLILTLCWPYVYLAFTLRPHVYLMSTLRTLCPLCWRVYLMFTLCLSYVYPMFTLCWAYVYIMLTFCWPYARLIEDPRSIGPLHGFVPGLCVMPLHIVAIRSSSALLRYLNLSYTFHVLYHCLKLSEAILISRKLS